MSLRDRTRSESQTAIFAVVDLLQQQRPKRGFCFKVAVLTKMWLEL